MRGGDFLKGKEGRVGFRKRYHFTVSSIPSSNRRDDSQPIRGKIHILSSPSPHCRQLQPRRTLAYSLIVSCFVL